MSEPCGQFWSQTHHFTPPNPALPHSALCFSLDLPSLTSLTPRFTLPLRSLSLGFLGGTEVKNLPAGDTRDMGFIPGSGRSPGVENSNPLQCCCLENSMDREAQRAAVHEITKSGTQVSTHTVILGPQAQSVLTTLPSCLNKSSPGLHCFPGIRHINCLPFGNSRWGNLTLNFKRKLNPPNKFTTHSPRWEGLPDPG